MLPETPLVDAARGPLPPAARARPLPEQLQRLGLRPRLIDTGRGLLAGGVALRLSFADMAASPELSAQVLDRLRRVLIDRVPATVTLADLGDRGRGFGGLERICRQLCTLLAAPCIDRRRLGIAVHAGDLSLPSFRLVSRVLLGPGARFLLLDTEQMRAGAAGSIGRESAAIWSSLYLQRNRLQRVVPVYGGGVRSRCPLLGDEASGTVLPQRSILVPPDSAWLPLELHLHRFADGRGAVDERRLKHALEHGLDVADSLLDRLCWTDRIQQLDACMNRRIAVSVHGIGDLVALRGDDPGNLDTLRAFDRLLSHVHAWLWERSRRLAAQRGLLPALQCHCPSVRGHDGDHRRDWRRRWRKALETDAVRHRNLLVLSPYGVMPRSGAGQPAYAALLPLIAHADACSFAGAPSFRNWNIHEFKHFHHLAYATMQRRNAASFIAAGA